MMIQFQVHVLSEVKQNDNDASSILLVFVFFLLNNC